MGLYKTMKTSDRLEEKGIWLDIGETRILLARAGGKNTKFTAAAEKLAREHKRSLELIGEKQGRKLFAKIYSENVVLDWLTKIDGGSLDEDGEVITDDKFAGDRYERGISGPDDKLIEFSVENVLKTFDDLPDLLVMVKQTAEDASLFRQSLIEDVTGN